MFSHYMRENPIVARLLGLIIISSSVITLLAIFLQLHSIFKDDVTALERRIDQVQVSTLASITKSLWGFDQDQLKIQVDSVLQVKDVVKVSVKWNDWNGEAQELLVKADTFNQTEFERRPSQYLIRSYPLLYHDDATPEQQLGVLTVTASLNSIYDRLWERALYISFLQGAKTLLIALFVIWLIHSLLTSHIKTIGDYARKLKLESLNTPLKLKRYKINSKMDELDNVVDAINHMRQSLLDDIEKRHAIEVALLEEQEQKQQTEKQKNAAEDASRAKSQFLATMSHEIRTPMNGVIGMVEMLRDTPLDDNQKHYVDVIHRSGETLLAIINDILDYSKIEAGKMQLESVEFDLNELVENCIQLFGATSNKRRVELFGGLEKTVPQKIKGDPTRLRQIIINLLGNAFKFTSDGFVSITVIPVSEQDNHAENTIKLKFLIQDSGIGIDANKVDNLFSSFNQADASTTRKYGGTGLGLAICKSLVELMNGVIGVESIKGKGSTFWFTADLQVVAQNQHNTTDIALTQRRGLLVESNQYLSEFIGKHLREVGANLEIAKSSKLALAGLKQSINSGELFDYLVVDNDLLDSTGIESLQKIRADLEFKKIPLIVLSSGDYYFDQQELIELAITKVLRKPVSMKILEQELTELFGVKGESSVLSDYEVKKDHGKFAGKKVLVAEDNPVNRMVIKGLLSKLGITPEFAENGRLAVEKWRSESGAIDFVLMDCEMPEMDGFEATKEIRKIEAAQQHPQTIIIALTAHALQEHREAVFAAGMNYYLSKPVTLDSLYGALESVGINK